jgi:hypothetical protein
MNIDRTLQDARRGIAALDFTAENERVAGINQQLADIEAALQRARDRHAEILQLLRPFSGAHDLASTPVLNERDGRSIADALLAGKDTGEATEERITRDKLERERDALREGIAELTRRTREIEMQRSEVKSAAGRRTLEELRPLCAALEAEAREAAQVIVRDFAALTAIGRATNTNPPGLNTVATAINGLRGPGQLVSPAEDIQVPAEVLELIDLLLERGPAHVTRVGKSVQEPAAPITAALVTPRAAPRAGYGDRGWNPFRRVKTVA